MSEVIRNRTIRPSTRLESSKSYKVNTKTVGNGDVLVVSVDHESKSFSKRYTFSGKDVAHRDSISYRVTETASHIDISWSGVVPREEGVNQGTLSSTPKPKVKSSSMLFNGQVESFAAIEDQNTKVLILGTMPGVESLKHQAYYAHPRNLFWRILVEITGHELPKDYSERVQLSKSAGIGLWDTCQACVREGSLDSAISEETPNDIEGFVNSHPNLKAIAFNGKKAAQLFAKHIGAIPGIRLLRLPSTSPANAGVSREEKVREWGKIKEYL